MHSCATTSAGLVYCWGSSAGGKTGYLGVNQTVVPREDAIPLTATVARVSAGYEHTCALTSTGEIFCWGDNKWGQLGYSDPSNVGFATTPDQAGPVELGGTAAVVVAGGQHTCALLDTNEVVCWGESGAGQLGYGIDEVSSLGQVPADLGIVDMGDVVTQIALGYRHTCALVTDGRVRCWGANRHGQLGYAHTDTVGVESTPATYNRTVNLGQAAVAIALGTAHSCALLVSGDAMCWGSNERGQVGVGLAPDELVGDDEEPHTKGRIDLGGQGAAITAGGEHTCVLLRDNTVRCWGAGHSGILGCGNCAVSDDDDTRCDIPAASATCNVSVWKP